ncbi:carbohydrate-binding protein [Maribacter sp. MAR_2009_72]|uniref:carbohydrate-binding protein n=1 Tax=Maribacter sp. MAR_2009_72 TaxID=1250050 RepID=UPI00119BB786|nr:carbohydrate-binding protein [Maribacter sp. MAR_2009_72]TVZ14920.1 putative secreted protein (Por secretion system target) [Maribacter sp. MAR_2009_72]
MKKKFTSNFLPRILVRDYNFVVVTILVFTSLFGNKIIASDTEMSHSGIKSKIDNLQPTHLAVIQPVADGLWSNPGIWPGNQLPSQNDDVIIPAGRTVTLVGICRAKTVRVDGTLNAVNWQSGGAWIDLETQGITIENGGLMEIGTEAQPYYANEGGPELVRCQITLLGSKVQSPAPSYKGIMVKNGGALELHGKEKMSWTNLGATANAGTNQITLVEPVDWEIGDEITLTATELVNVNNSGWERVDEAKITQISVDNRTLTLEQNLNYKHIGDSIAYTRVEDGKTWNVKIQGEVGLLSHYIKIQGDMSGTNEADGFGGHIMMMKGSTAHVENVELYKMGQKGEVARYPFHWHLNEDDAQGSYLKNSSVHKSFNRAVTIHGTEYVTVDGVFAYDHIGHGIFFEDGTERYNTIKNNVVLSTRRPLPGEEVTPSDNELRQAQNQTPASYWITNPNNYFENNVAAGTDGTGFWFALPEGPIGLSAILPQYNGQSPWTEPLGSFDGFVAHNCKNGWDIFDGLTTDHSIIRNKGWNVNTNQYFRNGIFYGNHQAIYTGIGGGAISAEKYVVFQDCIFTDNIIVTMLASDITLENCLFNADSGFGVFTGTRSFYRFYDGPGRHINCHFETWNQANALMISPEGNGGATENFNPTYQGITKGFSEPFSFRYNDENPAKERARKMGHFFKDLDGSLTGSPGTIVRDIPFLTDGHEYRHPSWYKAARSDYNFSGLWIRQINDDTDISVSRTKPGTADACFVDKGNEQDAGTYKFPLVVNEDFTYTFHFNNTPSSNIHMIWDYGDDGDLALVKLKNFGKFTNFRIDGAGFTFPKVTSQAAVESATDFAYYIEPNGDVYMKLIDIGDAGRREFFLKWDNIGSYQPPVLPCTVNDFTPGTSTTAINLPGNFEAEAFATKTGSVNTENTPGGGGSQNLGFILNGDYTEYLVNAAAGTYDVDMLASSAGSGGTVEIYSDNVLKGSVTVPVNGAWHNYQAYSTQISLDAGSQTLKLVFIGGSGYLFNIDRLETTVATNPTGDNDGDGLTQAEESNVCMSDNDAGDFSYDFVSTDQGFTQANHISAWVITAQEEYLMRVDNLIDPYIVKEGLSINANEVSSIVIRGKTQVTGGQFQLFWTTASSPNFSANKMIASGTVTGSYQDFTFNVGTHPEWQNETITKLRIDLPTDPSGSFHTWVDHVRGADFIENACSTSLKINTSLFSEDSEYVQDNNQMAIYPNPVSNILSISGTSSDMVVEVFDFSGVFQMRKQLEINESKIDVSSLVPGLYLLRIINSSNHDEVKVYKLLKN